MEKKEIIDKVLLKTLMDKKVEQLTWEPTNVLHFAGLDSLDTMEIIMELETIFHVKISNKQIGKVRTFQDIYDLFIVE